MTFKEKRGNSKSIFVVLIMILLAGGLGYIYLSPVFEQNKPNIESEDKIYWNLKTNLKIKLSDESGIKYYRVTFKDGVKDIVLNQEVLADVKK